MTNSRPRVSVVMIFYNAERFIREAIESVLRQTFADWELLLVDDGSTDGGAGVALGYCRDHPLKLTYLSHPGLRNRGISASRNLGVEHSRGELIAFLDADDVWERRKLEEQVAILEAVPEAAMVYGATRYWFSWTGREEDRNKDYVPELGVKPDTLIEPPLLLPVLLRNQIVTSTSGLIRRDVIDRVGGYEEGFRGMFEDQAFYAKVCMNAPVFVSQRCWYRYRKHPASCCSVVEGAGRQYAERLAFLSWLEGYLSDRGETDRDIRRCLVRAKLKCRYPTLARIPDHIRYRRSIMKEQLKTIARRTLPPAVYGWLKSRRNGNGHEPPVGGVGFGSLHRLTPISRVFGYDRGRPVDRYYIENFLARNASDVRGRVLEVGDDSYTQMFGGSRVTQSDVLHVSEGNPKATVTADLSSADHIPSHSFDCIILTQTLHLVFDVRAAIKTLHRILKPGGVLLLTVPGISQIDHYDWGGTWYWSFTTLSARRLFAEAFSESSIEVQAHGNVLAAISFLHGLAVEDLKKEELDFSDRDYEVTISVRAVKEVG